MTTNRRRLLPAFVSLLAAVAWAQAGWAGPSPSPIDGGSAASRPKWTIFPSTSPGEHSSLGAMAMVSRIDGWAVGSRVIGVQQSVDFVQRWNGRTWSLFPSADVGAFSSGLSDVVAVAPDDAWAVGFLRNSTRAESLIEHWDGTAWSVVPSANANGDTHLQAISASSSDDVWAAGSYIPSGQPNKGKTFFEHWDGTTWSMVGSPNTPDRYNDIYDVLALSPEDAWAVGFHQAGPLEDLHLLILHWDGEAWSIVPGLDPPDAVLFGLTATASDDVWAVGASHVSDVPRTLAMHWNGLRWRVVPSPSPGSNNSSLGAVRALARNDVWAVGGYRDTPDGQLTLTEHWNGRRWRIVPSPSIPTERGGNGLSSVDAVGPGDVWSVGRYFSDDSGTQIMIQHYGRPFCGDGRDSDGDGLADYPDDPGCTSSTDEFETGPIQCDDGVDNDLDGKVDFYVNGSGDQQCASAADDSELLPGGLLVRGPSMGQARD